MRPFAPLLVAAALGAAATASGPAPCRADDLDDLLGGFEVEEEFEVEVQAEDGPAPPRRPWDLDGSVSLSSSINYLDHESATGTDYTGLSRLRTRLNLELDWELSPQWKFRLSPYVWYDFAYLAHGRHEFTGHVLNEYEWEFDFQDSYLEGSITRSLDLKLGRQVVNWGRSDTLRVLDVLNPVDNREPGRADIEDLRWSVTMARLDQQIGRHWVLTGIAIPEIRVDTLPPFGSDFNPSPLPEPRHVVPKDFQNWEWAVALSGVFEGWDVSFHFAYFFEDIPRLALTSQGLVLRHERLWLGGLGGNYAVGSWLFKAEAAWLQGFEFFVAPGDEKSRIDAMGGVEYYGFNDTTIALEVVNRHYLDFDGIVLGFPDFQRENSVETALRLTRDWLHARLTTTALAVLFGWRAQDGVVLRFQADYTILDALVATAGILIYEGGDLPPLDRWDSNDRVFLELKYSF